MNASDNPRPPREIKRIPGVNAGDNETVVVIDYEWFDFQIVTDADLSAMGEARHKTVNGRGAVGRLIDKKDSTIKDKSGGFRIPLNGRLPRRARHG